MLKKEMTNYLKNLGATFEMRDLEEVEDYPNLFDAFHERLSKFYFASGEICFRDYRALVGLRIYPKQKIPKQKIEDLAWGRLIGDLDLIFYFIETRLRIENNLERFIMRSQCLCSNEKD